MIENATQAEVEAYIAANPTAVDTVFKPALTTKEYSLMSKAEKTQYDSDRESQIVSARTSKIAPKVEKYVKDTTGVDKTDSNEKYYVYQNRVMKELADEKKSLSEQVETFKKSSNLSQVERTQLDNLIEIQKVNQKELEDLKLSSSKEINKAKLENELGREMAPVSAKLIKSTIPGVEKAKEIMSNQIFAEMQEMATKDSRGKIILMKSETEAITTENGNFKTVAQYYEEKMTEAGFVDNGKTITGAGGEGGKAPAGTSIPGNCKSQVELMDFLRANTMKGKSQVELMKEFDKYAHLLSR